MEVAGPTQPGWKNYNAYLHSFERLWCLGIMRDQVRNPLKALEYHTDNVPRVKRGPSVGPHQENSLPKKKSQSGLQ